MYQAKTSMNSYSVIWFRTVRGLWWFITETNEVSRDRKITLKYWLMRKKIALGLHLPRHDYLHWAISSCCCGVNSPQSFPLKKLGRNREPLPALVRAAHKDDLPPIWRLKLIISLPPLASAPLSALNSALLRNNMFWLAVKDEDCDEGARERERGEGTCVKITHACTLIFHRSTYPHTQLSCL